MITLPYPPSLNGYYRTVNGRMLISKKGREYRKIVAYEALTQKAPKMGAVRLSLVIRAYMPDKRKRDIDNILKCLLDSLQHAGIYDDDSQIDFLSVARCEVEKPGRVEISLKTLTNKD